MDFFVQKSTENILVDFIEPYDNFDINSPGGLNTSGPLNGYIFTSFGFSMSYLVNIWSFSYISEQ